MMKILTSLLILFTFFVISIFGINFYVLKAYHSKIYNDKEKILEAYTCIVLGARVFNNGDLSDYLQDRVDAALELYELGKIKRFLLSGDHGTVEYDEVNAMKNYLIEKGVPTSDIFLDHAGFNTYNSMVRALKVFNVNNCVIVSQDYHLPRAVYIANKIGLKAEGLATSSERFPSASFNKKREILARNKSFFEVLFNIKPQFLGPQIPITGNSDLSFD